MQSLICTKQVEFIYVYIFCNTYKITKLNNNKKQQNKKVSPFFFLETYVPNFFILKSARDQFRNTRNATKVARNQEDMRARYGTGFIFSRLRFIIVFQLI